MTVSDTTRRTSAVGANTAGQIIPFSFPVSSSSELTVLTRVTATGVESVLTLGADYTVSLSEDVGGTVTLVSAVATTSEVHVIRNNARTQTLDLAQGGTFNAELLEDSLDKLTRIANDNYDGISRSLRIPKSDSTTLDMEIPNSVDRADQYLAFDSSGEPTVVSSVAPDTATITSYMETFLTKANAADALTYLGASAFIQTLLDDATALEARATLGTLAADDILTYDNDVLSYEGNVITWNV